MNQPSARNASAPPTTVPGVWRAVHNILGKLLDRTEALEKLGKQLTPACENIDALAALVADIESRLSKIEKERGQ